ncbi:response regulator transcription factor [Halorarius halobius]|uniref:response regulator transcription factor n=1 Tax=Halorarius halobius TaxID=2962671 RepID=UPI0020CB98E9|nr:response regulator [Halorarius halobius]
MAADGGAKPHVLVVEDEEKIRETYELWLYGDYEVSTATDGEEALSLVDGMDGSPDIALLDRMMPGLSGRETLAELRDRDLDCQYAMVTAVEPDFDIIEMGFDAYVTKPVAEAELRETLADLRSQSTYEDVLDEYTTLLEKKETLEAHKSDEELADSAEFQRLQERLDELDDRLDDASAEEDAGFVATLREIETGADSPEEDG